MYSAFTQIWFMYSTELADGLCSNPGLHRIQLWAAPLAFSYGMTSGHFRVMHRSWLILATFFISLLVVTAFDGTVINFGEALSNLQRSYPKHHFPVVRAQRFYYPIAEVNRY
ncbi:hypothetical protein NECAME_11539 [Necator americanus]|uniref:Uncharacterized protein n=1 Tax=Necator americanus TaxID=51031 RepID=W2T603_NECAM|nr:hypothetical protein NECAME_11539 [Necator americanus]ETN76616.1 hypothetical protein NECAME_11539 [Necator americanus]